MPATPASESDETGTPALQEQPPPACVMSFNASDATGAGGIAGDIATIAAMGAHALPVVTSIVLRDTAEIFEHSTLDPVTYVQDSCVGCGLCGEAAPAAVLCPSFYRVEIVNNPTRWDRLRERVRGAIIGALQRRSAKRLDAYAF